MKKKMLESFLDMRARLPWGAGLVSKLLEQPALTTASSFNLLTIHSGASKNRFHENCLSLFRISWDQSRTRIMSTIATNNAEASCFCFFVQCHRYTVSKPVSPTKRCLFSVCLFVEISNLSRGSIAAATAACHASAVVLLFLATRYQCVKNVETATCTWGKHTLASSWSIATFLWLHKKGDQRKWELGTTNWRKNVLLVIRKESEWGAHTRNRHEVWWEYSQERRIQVHQEIATTVRKVGVLFWTSPKWSKIENNIAENMKNKKYWKVAQGKHALEKRFNSRSRTHARTCVRKKKMNDPIIKQLCARQHRHQGQWQNCLKKQSRANSFVEKFVLEFQTDKSCRWRKNVESNLLVLFKNWTRFSGFTILNFRNLWTLESC